jgi:hypothetical protein
LGAASLARHWDFTPPNPHLAYNGNVAGILDHSQVFHRLPTSLRWMEDIKALKNGDGRYFNQLTEHFGAIYPIAKGQVLSMEHLFK